MTTYPEDRHTTTVAAAASWERRHSTAERVLPTPDEYAEPPGPKYPAARPSIADTLVDPWGPPCPDCRRWDVHDRACPRMAHPALQAIYATHERIRSTKETHP